MKQSKSTHIDYWGRWKQNFSVLLHMATFAYIYLLQFAGYCIIIVFF